MTNNLVYGKLIGVLGIALIVSACVVSTDGAKSSSESIETTSEASTGLSSSTSDEDNENEAKRMKIRAFASNNFARLREDIAVGGGEYLTSLAALFEIPEAMQPAFFQLAKDQFSIWVVSSQTTSDQLIAALTADLAKHPELWQ